MPRYSLAAAYKGGKCKQGAMIFHGGRVVVNFRCHGNKGLQARKNKISFMDKNTSKEILHMAQKPDDKE